MSCFPFHYSNKNNQYTSCIWLNECGGSWEKLWFPKLYINVKKPTVNYIKMTSLSHSAIWLIAVVVFFRWQIQRDGGAYESMPSGYPLLSGRGSKTVFLLRLPRFKTSVLYDPMIVLSQANHANNCMRVTIYQVLTFVLILTSGILI